MTGLDLESRLLYRDGLVLVIDKPAGLAVHAGGKGDHHLMMYLDQLRFGLPRAPELAHRLDKDTSGCLVLGRHRKALAQLGDLFAQGRAEKAYWAVVVGVPSQSFGVIETPLKKLEKRHGWRVVADPKGQPSVTEWTLLGSNGRLSWIEARPKTGRTHQIRVHLASKGWPIVGDTTYGRGTADLVSPHLHLHSRQIILPLSRNKPPIAVTAPVPDHMRHCLEVCGYQDPA